MRTTVDINDVLAARAKALAKSRNATLRELIEEGLRRVIEEESRRTSNFKLADMSVGTGGTHDGVDDTSWSSVSRILYPDP